MNLIALQNWPQLSELPQFAYIHFPLCKHTCSYCDFNVFNQKKALEALPDFEARYVSTLGAHLEQLRALNRNCLKSLYLGGGTPSLLSVEGLYRIRDLMGSRWDLALEEFTLEVNPESVISGRAKDWAKLGVSRLSLGVQSFQPNLLKRLERLATSDHIVRALDDVASNFSNFSIDLMLGVPDQGMDELERDLELLKRWNPPHVSIYLLTLSEDHVLRTHAAMKDRLADDDLAERLYLRVCEVMSGRGYEHYETSNFARPGFRSLHNSNYWNPQSSYLGLGPGAHGYFSELGLRYQTIKDPVQWMDSKSGLSDQEILNAEQHELEVFYLKLRTRQPLLVRSFRPDVVNKLVQEGLLNLTDDSFCVTDRGWLLIESLAQRLLS